MLQEEIDVMAFVLPHRSNSKERLKCKRTAIVSFPWQEALRS